MSDHPYVRADRTCVNCGGSKGEGLVVCWPCNGDLKAQFDGVYGHVTENALTRREHYLHQKALKRARHSGSAPRA